MASTQNRTKALFDKLQRISRRSSDAGPKAVHQLRTTIRRIETLVASTGASPSKKEKKFLKQLDRLRRRAGKVRDLDVQIDALRSIHLDSVARDRSRVMAFLEKARSKQEAKLLELFEDQLDDGLAKRLKRTCTRLQEEAGSSSHRLEGFLSAALNKFPGLVRQYPVLNESNLHNFRIDCKRVRYLAEMSGEGPDVKPVLQQFKRIQDAVGIWHDWLTLTATAERVLSSSGQVPLLSALRAGIRSKYLEALRITADARHKLTEMHDSQRKSGNVVSKIAPAAATPMTRAAIA
jgi:CHAD domain-containing protein